MTQSEARAALDAKIKSAIRDHSSPAIDRGDAHGAKSQTGCIVWENHMPFVVEAIKRAIREALEDVTPKMIAAGHSTRSDFIAMLWASPLYGEGE